MGQITIVVPDELEQKLRSILPARRGAMSEYVREAIEKKLREDGHY